MFDSIFKTFLILSITTASVGCGGSTDAPPLAQSEGSVSFEGKPLDGATVSFIPANGRPASGFTDDNGHFVLTTSQEGDGALIGAHTVTITKTKPKAGQENNAYAEHVSVIPKKYGDLKKSDLTATVKTGEKNEFSFELKK